MLLFMIYQPNILQHPFHMLFWIKIQFGYNKTLEDTKKERTYSNIDFLMLNQWLCRGEIIFSAQMDEIISAATIVVNNIAFL